MAKAPVTKAAPTYDPEKMYEIKLLRPVKVGRTWLLPSQRNTVKGKVLEEIKDDVSDATEL